MDRAEIARNPSESLPKTSFLGRQARFSPVNGYPESTIGSEIRGSFEHETISMDDLRAGFGRELLPEAEAIIAVNTNSQEEVLFGESEWEVAVESGHEAELTVVRVELDGSDDADELREMIASGQSGVADDSTEESVDVHDA